MSSHLTSSPKRRKRPEIKALTSLRFFAALLIFLLHCSNHELLPQDAFQLFDLSKAVSLFFVLSGFVLTYAYFGNVINFRSFILARFSRIWPVTFAALIFTILFLPSSLYLPSGNSMALNSFSLAANILCIQSLIPVPDYFFGFNAVSWSISAEIFFYFCFPWLNRQSFSKLIATFVFTVILAFASASSVDYLGISGYNPLLTNFIAWEGIVYINPIVRLPEFILGVIACRIFFDTKLKISGVLNKDWSLFSRFLRDFFEITILVALLAFGFGALVFPLNVDFGGVPVKLVANQLMSGLSFALLLLVIIFSRNHLIRLMESPLCTFLGKISFGLYLFHQPLMIRSAQYNGLNISKYQLLPENYLIIFFASLSIACLSFLYLEIPMQRFLRSKMS